MLADDRLAGDSLLSQLSGIRDQDGVPAFSEALHALTHLRLAEAEAARLVTEVVKHREGVAGMLGRDPGLRVAAIDYLSNINPLLTNPTIVERSQLEATERSALTDPLTRLYNRRQFMRALGPETRRSRRYTLDLSLLMLDLDAFKELNDEHGHLFGDLILQRVGQVLRRAVRDPDIACRFGGDEFAVILPETDRLGCYAVAQRIRSRIEQSFHQRPVGNRLVQVGVSGGIASFPDDGADPSTLVARADQALYLAKSLGKNRISLYHAERRRSIRYPARAAASATVRDEAGADPHPVRLIDVSSGGVLMEQDRQYAPGRAVELTFGGRDAEGRNRSWVVAARIVRFERGSEAGPSRAAAAFEQPLAEDCLEQQVSRSAALTLVKLARGPA